MLAFITTIIISFRKMIHYPRNCSVHHYPCHPSVHVHFLHENIVDHVISALVNKSIILPVSLHVVIAMLTAVTGL